MMSWFGVKRIAEAIRSPEYVIVQVGKSEGIKHLACGKTSYSVSNVRERYCAHCHVYIADPQLRIEK